jgi:phosphoribosylcarboxyaminoimidazole (NCAIR) mutase
MATADPRKQKTEADFAVIGSGIGVPAVAVSGMIAANTLVPVRKHWKLLGELS